MLSKSPSAETGGPAVRGTLYVVSTPIGNREDITLRALKVLKAVDWVAAEDTRHSGRLLAGYDIKTRLISYHEHNETARTPQLIQKLNQGLSIALLTNAGTPTVSDPGYRLVTAAIAGGIPVVPIPGASALTTALSAAGLPTDAFVFAGFLPRSKKKRLEQLHTLACEERTFILYEAPGRIAALLDDILDIMGDRYAVLCREMTKVHEEYLRGGISELRENLAARTTIKGECTLLVSGRVKARSASPAEIEQAILSGLQQNRGGLKALSQTLARQFNVSRKEIYTMALRLKKEP